jgi:nitrogen fixation/metabolism regulation signal transduction histidine kinase
MRRIGLKPGWNRKMKARNRIFYYYIPAGLLAVSMVVGKLIYNATKIFYLKDIGISLLLFSMPILLVYFIIFAVIKLIVELRNQKVGSRFQVRILMNFLIIIFITVLPMMFFLDNVFRRSFDFWILTDIRNALESAGKLAQWADFGNRNSLKTAADKLINTAQGNPALLDPAVLKDTTAGYLRVYSSGKLVSTWSMAGDSPSLITTKELIEYRIKDDFFLKKEINKNFYLLYVRPVPPSTILVFAQRLDPGYFSQISSIEKGFMLYRQMSLFQAPVRTFFSILLADFVLLVIFISLVLSIVFAKEIARPVLLLSEATQNIAAGRLETPIKYDSPDEMKSLIHSFNRMMKELSFNQQAVVHSQHLEAWRKASVQSLDKLRAQTAELIAFVRDSSGSLPEGQEVLSRIKDLEQALGRFGALTETSRLPLKKENVNDIVRDVMEMFEGVESNISFFLDLDNSVPLLNINRSEVHQTLVNLVKNAIEAAPKKSKGLVKIRSQFVQNFNASFVSIEIIDNGPGPTNDAIAHLFEPYFSTKKNKQGLGLSVVKRIMQEHEGRVNYKRIDGKTVFVLEFPV